MIRIAVPALTILLTVAAFVGLSGWNRSGEPRMVMTLTERELLVSGARDDAEGDHAGLELSIAVEHRRDPLDARNWLPESRLRALGFDLDVPAGAPTAKDVYDHVPPRRAWIVFEYDGPAFRAIERRRALETQDPSRRPGWTSRLVPVDAGLNFDVLRRSYPSGHLILPGVIGLVFVAPDNGGPLVHGTLQSLTPGTLAVPAALEGVFDGLVAPAEASTPAPRYEVELAIGELGWPYVRNARRLN